MDWIRFSNPAVAPLQWRKVRGVPTTHAAGRRIELFKELVWKGWRHVPMWGYRISGVAQGGRFKTMRQAKAQAELHARRLRDTATKPTAVPEGVEPRRRPKRVPLERKDWWGLAENPSVPSLRDPDDALRRLAIVEGEEWLRTRSKSGQYSLEGHVEAFRELTEYDYEDKESTQSWLGAPIYGAGGYARYGTRPGGEIFLMGGTSRPDHEEKARAAGFRVV